MQKFPNSVIETELNIKDQKKINIGCSSGFWGDSLTAPHQLVKQNNHKLDYLVCDYLAEVTMCILARGRGKTEEQVRGGMGAGGYIKEFVTALWKPLMKDILKKGIKVVSNAGGMNPIGLKLAIEQACREEGMEIPVVAAVIGDDLTDISSEFREKNYFENFDVQGEIEKLWDPKKKLMSCNAYLGAVPVAKALQEGAQIVITGRCVDSAIVLGPLIYEFGWSLTDFDKLASGSLAGKHWKPIGHIIECGCHTTGGNFTDWRLSYEQGWMNVGFPIAECFSDGSFIVTKPDNTGGIVTPHTVSEQLVYEIHDPGAYILADVVCDFRNVKLTQLLDENKNPSNRVLVQGAKGQAPTQFYKVSSTLSDGYSLVATLVIGGIDAKQKAEAVSETILARTRMLLSMRKIPDFIDTSVELLGTESTYGENSVMDNSREVILKIGVQHTNQMALGIFAKELAPSALSMAPGIMGSTGRPRPGPRICLYSSLIKKDKVPIKIKVGENLSNDFYVLPTSFSEIKINHEIPLQKTQIEQIKTELSQYQGEFIKVPLICLALGRSGDKGDVANIGVIARNEKFYSFLSLELTEEKVSKFLKHTIKGGTVKRYTLPGILAFNFVITKSLGGGGFESLQIDKQGKAFAQNLLSLPLNIPKSWLPLANFKEIKPSL